VLLLARTAFPRFVLPPIICMTRVDVCISNRQGYDAIKTSIIDNKIMLHCLPGYTTASRATELRPPGLLTYQTALPLSSSQSPHLDGDVKLSMSQVNNHVSSSSGTGYNYSSLPPPPPLLGMKHLRNASIPLNSEGNLLFDDNPSIGPVYQLMQSIAWTSYETFPEH